MLKCCQTTSRTRIITTKGGVSLRHSTRDKRRSNLNFAALWGTWREVLDKPLGKAFDPCSLEKRNSWRPPHLCLHRAPNGALVQLSPGALTFIDGSHGRQERRFDPEIQIACPFVCLTKNALQVEDIVNSYSVIPRFLTHPGGSFNVVYRACSLCVACFGW